MSSDLQCPATAVLLPLGDPAPAWLVRLPVAGRFAASGWAHVISLVNETADLYRGETFAVTAPAADLAEALHRRGIVAQPPVIVEVDSGGWRMAPEP